VDIFISQAGSYATTEAVNTVKEALRTNTGVVGWDTTNLVNSSYRDILKAADANKRTVRFIRW
jgi:hypothetical protein